jgi:hypothetical protein
VTEVVSGKEKISKSLHVYFNGKRHIHVSLGRALYLFFRHALYLIVVLGGDLPQTVSDLFMVE